MIDGRVLYIEAAAVTYRCRKPMSYIKAMESDSEIIMEAKRIKMSDVETNLFERDR